MDYPDYHEFAVFKKSKELTKAVFLRWEKFPHTKTADVIFHQLIRACTSIGANIVEGYGRFNKNEQKQFLKIARGSSFETEYWLELTVELLSANLSDLIELNKEIIKLLTTMINKLNSA